MKKIIIIILFVFLLLIQITLSARLPIVNSDLDNWGNLLNNYLRIAHGTNGSINASTDAIFQKGINIGSGFLTVDSIGITNISTLVVRNSITLGGGFSADNAGSNISNLNVGQNFDVGNGRLTVNNTSGITSITNLVASFSSLTIIGNTNASVSASITNNNAGDNAVAQFILLNDVGFEFGCLITSSGHSFSANTSLCSTDTPLFLIENENLNIGAIEFDTNETSRLFIDTDGNIGMGTNTPSHELNLIGNLNITGTEIYFPNLIKCSDLITPCANNDTIKILMPIGQLCCI